MRTTGVLAAVLSVLLLTGCVATPTETTVYSPESGLNTAYTDAALGLDYAVPVQTPRIVIDQVGYLADEEKKALVLGEVLPDTFSVIRMEDETAVYEGSIRESANGVGVAEFSDFTEAGTYYLQADALGVSYAFSIGEDVYQDAFVKAQKQFYLNRCGTSLTEQYAQEAAHSVCHTLPARLQEDAAKTMDVTGGWHLDTRLNRSVTEGCKALNQMLLAYEMNPDAFSDETGIPESGNGVADILDEARYEVQWLLKMQDETSGGVYAAAVTDVEEGGNAMIADVNVTPITTEATGTFAASLAHFSALYHAEDEAFANTCLQAADKAFRLFHAAPATADTGLLFHAACALYRATGDARYAEVIAPFFQGDAAAGRLSTDDDFFYGAVAYLSTTAKVDVDACNALMEVLTAAAREVASDAGASPFFVAAKKEDEADVRANAQTMLHNLRVLSVVNHILFNHEYEVIIANHAHYLMGRNEQAVNLVTDDSEYSYLTAGMDGVRAEPLQTAELIFLLSALV